MKTTQHHAAPPVHFTNTNVTNVQLRRGCLGSIFHSAFKLAVIFVFIAVVVFVALAIFSGPAKH